MSIYYIIQIIKKYVFIIILRTKYLGTDGCPVDEKIKSNKQPEVHHRGKYCH